ncbi:MAG: cation:proton antiporter [Patulibacter sp.]|nr:cation:proton antiporter [Patulibacter sp.]
MSTPVLAGILSLEAPHGPPWEFFVVFAVLLLGPVLMQRAALPGLVGLLLGGYAIGPHGFGWIGAGNTTIPELGQLGLLYLMFVAGVELDLNLLRRFRNRAIGFGLLTFTFPMLFGAAVGFALGWGLAAALLLGSMLASHTLLVYPIVRNARLAGNPAAASVVGATVLADTLSLVVLAAVAGSVQGGGSLGELIAQIGIGLVGLLAFCFLVLPRVARLAFDRLGTERTVRYVVALTALLSAATVAEVLQIEGIVGAFFAGLALNRLVPNEGPLMERIDFFGGAIFIPVFLVSVGLILDPAVMIQPETLGIAALLTVACLGGKGLAALLARPLLGFTRGEVALAFALSTPQAAATLATVMVGLQIGLFSTTVVNATLVLILVSVIVSTVVATRAVQVVPPTVGRRPLGARVAAAFHHAEDARDALRRAAALAERDGGVVQPVLVRLESDEPVDGIEDRVRAIALQVGVDGELATVVERSLLHGAIHAGLAADASLVLIAGAAGDATDGDPATVAAIDDGRVAFVDARERDDVEAAPDEQDRMVVVLLRAAGPAVRDEVAMPA